MTSWTGKIIDFPPQSLEKAPRRTSKLLYKVLNFYCIFGRKLIERGCFGKGKSYVRHVLQPFLYEAYVLLPQIVAEDRIMAINFTRMFIMAWLLRCFELISPFVRNKKG